MVLSELALADDRARLGDCAVVVVDGGTVAEDKIIYIHVIWQSARIAKEYNFGDDGSLKAVRSRAR